MLLSPTKYSLYVPRKYKIHVPSIGSVSQEEPWGQEDPWDVRFSVSSLGLEVTHSEPLSLFLLPGMIVPHLPITASSSARTLKKSLTQWNSAPFQTIAVLSLALDSPLELKNKYRQQNYTTDQPAKEKVGGGCPFIEHGYTGYTLLPSAHGMDYI